MAGRHCAILIGDNRQRRHDVFISLRVLRHFLDVGLILREDIIKVQHKMKSTRERWSGPKYDFYLIYYHEHLFEFRKPAEGETSRSYNPGTFWM